MGKRKVTLSVDDRVYKDFQKYCEKNDIMLSKRVERLMKREMLERDRPGVVGLKEMEEKEK
jgi:hypothetical protein